MTTPTLLASVALGAAIGALNAVAVLFWRRHQFHWRSIGSAPKHTWVLAADSGDGDIYIARWDGWSWVHDDMGECHPTHWQPLPEAPERP